MAEVTFNVTGMTCGHCRENVTRALRVLDGVADARVDLEKGTATVIYDETRTGPKALANAVTEAGYAVRTDATAAEVRRGGCCCH